MLKNLALIVAHCDTQEKTDVLNTNIDYLNQFNDKLDIILVSYLPVDEKIVSKVRYFIYDNENPIIKWPEKGIFVSEVYGEVELKNWTIDYGWCIANKIKMAGDLLRDKEYGGVYFMNYDVKLSEPLLNKIDEETIEDVILVTVKDVASKVVNVPAAAELPPITVPSIAPLSTSIFVMF